MSGHPPIDPRDRDALVAQTTALAERYSAWRPPEDGHADAGRALIGVFARFTELVVERINRAPDRNYLAFLNLIGTEPLPPLPARVPLTFTLAEGAPGGAVVPAGTQVSAPQLPGETIDVIFSTESDLVVTGAQLQAVIVSDAESDTWSDRTAVATGQQDGAFEAFVGDQSTPHELYLACDPVLAAPGVKDVTFTLPSSPPGPPLTDLPTSWAYWDGTDWRAALRSAAGAAEVSLSRLPQLPLRDVGGITASWVRARLDAPLPRGESGIAPESVAVGGRPPQDEVAGLFPFGETTQAKWFYLSVDEAVAVGGAKALLEIGPAPGRAGVAANRATPVQLIWSYKVGSEWREIGRSASNADQVGGPGFRDTSRAMTRTGTVQFGVPPQWPREAFRGRLGRWLRVEIADAGGGYGTLPQLASLTAGYSWDLPAISKVTVARVNPVTPAALPAAFAASTPLDVTKDFLPFGQHPAFNSTFYLACPAELVAAAPLTVVVTMTNAADSSPVTPVRTDRNPAVAWEAWDGKGWKPVTVDRPGYAFTTDATLQLSLPAGFAPTAVNGEERHWLRVRLVRGDYGQPAGYTQTDGSFALTAATLSPPMIKSLTFAPGGVQTAQVPVTACVSRNDFGYRTHGVGAGAPAFTPFVPAAESDPALYLGFDRPFDPLPVTVYLQVEPPAPEDVAADRFAQIDTSIRAQLVWEYSGPDGWRPLDALDGTGALAARGTVMFVGPTDLTAREYFDRRCCWLRVRWSRGQFVLAPRLRRVAPNTTWAEQAVTVVREVLGSGTGEPGQSFTTSQSPLLAGQQVEVQESLQQREPSWVQWTPVADFHGSGSDDRHYTTEPLTGKVRFGDGLAGRVLPLAAGNVRITYRTGGGEAGNRAAGTIVTLNSAVPYVDAVTNHEPAQGGYAGEPIERLRSRGPQALRHGNRAVTAQDVEDIAFAASAEVVRVRAVLPTRFDPYGLWLEVGDPPSSGHLESDAGRVGVIVVPDSRQARPAPSLALLRQVERHLRARCPATAQLWVAGPEWIRATVEATVVATSTDVADGLGSLVRQALEGYLHPLTGGTDGTGWAFGRKPHRSELMSVVERVPGVDHVRALRVELTPESESLGERLRTVLGRSMAQAATDPPAADLRRWLDRALLYSGRHRITLTLQG